MAIKFTPEYNADIRRRVHNFNQVRKRALDAGVPKNRIPNLVKVRDLKASIRNKNALERYLKHLERFSRKSTNELVNISDDYKVTKWYYNFVKDNRELAKQYFEDEYKRVEKRTSKYPGERDYLNTITAKIGVLEKDINALDDKEFRATLNAVNEFFNAPSLRKERYREYLSVVEEVMDTLEIDDDVKNKFFKNFEQLTPTQFLYAFDNNSIIERIYELYFKRNDDGTVQINTDEDSAKELVNSLLEQTDLIIEDAKANSV